MGQLGLFRRGGKRKGAGREPVHERAGSPHRTRPTIKTSHVMHVTIRVHSDIPALRRDPLYNAIRAATRTTANTQPHTRIVQMSVQNTHVHLIVEADDKLALARGMQGFQVSAAKRINRVLQRRGSVFTDRYHLVLIRSPKQMRAVFAYVFGNYKKHGADRHVPAMWSIDPFSRAYAFDGWAEDWMTLYPDDEQHEWLVVKPARSWLAREGWRRGGPLISVFERPGKRPD